MTIDIGLPSLNDAARFHSSHRGLFITVAQRFRQPQAQRREMKDAGA
jgi:hypothetical protein